jgi:hypothetical protein
MSLPHTISDRPKQIPDGLFPKEELAVDRWSQLCGQAQTICLDRHIQKEDFYPNQHSKSLVERTIGIALSNYRQAISGKGTSRHYEYVDNIITKHGFFHWIRFKTDEDKALYKWNVRIEDAKKIADAIQLPFACYYPSQRSPCPIEKEIGISLVNYRQALQEKGTHKVYDSVTELIEEECNHWLHISVLEKKALDQWRKRFEYLKKRAGEQMIPLNQYRPNRFSKDRKEKEIANAISFYQLNDASYKSVNHLLLTFH